MQKIISSIYDTLEASIIQKNLKEKIMAKSFDTSQDKVTLATESRAEARRHSRSGSAFGTGQKTH